MQLVFLHPHFIRCVIEAGARESLVGSGTNPSPSSFYPHSVAGGICR